MSTNPDVTFINMNLMFARVDGLIDKQNYAPLGIMYLSSYLKQAGFSCDLKDYQLLNLSDPFFPKFFLNEVKTTAKIVGFSCMANLLPFTILCARKLKASTPAVSIVLGGVGPSPVAEEIVNEFPFIDYVVVGEGENSILKIVKGEARCGVVKSDPVLNLDALPFPDYELLEKTKYDAAPSIVSSRGCSYGCTFCTEPFNFGYKIPLRSIDNVIEEVKKVNEITGATLFLFQDDNFLLNKERVREFSEAFADLDFKIQWKSFARVNIVDEEMLQLASRSGCVQLRYGIENGSNKVLEELKKGFTIEKAYEAVRKTTKYIPSVHASFMWGFPFETIKDVEESVRWMKKFEKAGATILLFQWSPLAGSQLYERYKGKLEFVDINYSNFVLSGHEVRWRPINLINPQHKEIYDLIKEYPNIFPGFYCMDYENNILRKLKYLLTTNFLYRKPHRNAFDR